MTKTEVLEMLEGYRCAVGRCGHLEVEIKETIKYIQDAMNNRAEDAAAPHAQQISGMPRGSGVGNPTEQIGIMLASKYVPDYIRNMEDHPKELQAEHDEQARTVSYVEKWLAGLTEKEHWIVSHKIIDGDPWAVCLRDYEKQHGEAISKDTLRRMRRRALNAIYRSAHAT